MLARAILASLLLVTWPTSCLCTFTTPRSPAEPTRVYLLRASTHTGLVLPRSSETWVEYGYGEWRWYAEADNSFWAALRSMIWPWNRGTLGRGEFAAHELDAIPQRYAEGRLQPFEVPRAEVVALLRRLDGEFESAHAARVVNDGFGMEFVPSHEHFWIAHNCADETASWLEALGCEVAWAPLRAALSLHEPTSARSAAYAE